VPFINNNPLKMSPTESANVMMSGTIPMPPLVGISERSSTLVLSLDALAVEDWGSGSAFASSLSGSLDSGILGGYPLYGSPKSASYKLEGYLKKELS
jgi:hypothetical protein